MTALPQPPRALWRHPADTLALKTNEVHVWRAELDLAPARVLDFRERLTDDERCRADRLHSAEHRRRFTVARAVLRTILGRYLDVAPSDVRFCYGPHGKPALIAEMAEETGLRFNVAHSHDIALYAVTRGREVGIDVERIRAEVASTKIAQRFFSPAEVAALLTLPDELQTEAFFACWTRKEAYIKATGGGLSHRLDSFDVSLTPGEPVIVLRTHGDPREAGRWSLRGLEPGPGYAAAVAVEATRWDLACWQWPE